MTRNRKKTNPRPDPFDAALRCALAVERLAIRAQAVLRMPTGTPARDAAQAAAMAAVDRAVDALVRSEQRGSR